MADKATQIKKGVEVSPPATDTGAAEAEPKHHYTPSLRPMRDYEKTTADRRLFLILSKQ